MKIIDPSELTEEKSLYAIYRQASAFPKNTFNQITTPIVAFLLVLYVFEQGQQLLGQ